MSIIKRVRIGRSSSQGRSQASLARSSAIMASGTLVSRILGMVRNALIVMALGATGSGAADAFNTANNLPTYLYNMMIGGILNAILVPQIVQALRRRNGEEVVNRLLTAAATLMLAVTCIATAAAPLIFTLNANSLAQGQWRALSFAFAFWFMPQVFFYGLYALWGQVLNARSSFGPYMWSPVLNNIISIASILLYLHLYGRYTAGEGAEIWGWGRITLIGATTTLGIAVQALILYIPLVRSGFRPRIIFGVRGLGLGKTVKVALWALAGVGVASLSNWITSNLGSYAVTASEQPEYANVIVPSTTMWLNAYLVYMLPQSLVVTSIITALFTRMSEKAAAGDAAGGVLALLDVHGQGEEVELVLGVLAHGGGGQDGGLTVEVGHGASSGLLGQAARLEAHHALAEGAVVDHCLGGGDLGVVNEHEVSFSRSSCRVRGLRSRPTEPSAAIRGSP